MPLAARLSEAANRMASGFAFTYYPPVSYACPIGPPKLAACGKPALLLPIRTIRRVASMKTPKQVSREAINDFKKIYKDEFGVELTDDGVKELATQLLRFFGILHTPLPGEDAGNYPASAET